MPRRLHQTMVDYVVIAISPALVMTLIGSLVFFLIAVLYQGEFALRLNWVMACFVFAAVLISRIAIEEGFERAAPFGVALAIVIALAANKFMEVHGTWIDNFAWAINWGLIALIWWCAHRLTWDCTLIDDEQDASGEGLMQTAGLERPAQADAQPDAPSERLEGTTSREMPSGWWQRYVERQRRPHAPGVWVVYFSLAALPLFGVGQWFIPEANVAGRRYVFWLLCVYVASGLGLLLTTSFLGLRRYLRQRRVEMPTLMANLWLGTGAALVAGLLVLAALLPRPSAEYEISQLPFTVGSPQGRASQSASVPREGARDEQAAATAGDQPPEDQQPDDQEQVKNADEQTQAGRPGKPSASEGQSAAGESRSGPSSQSDQSQSGRSASQAAGRSDEKSQGSQGAQRREGQPPDAQQSRSNENNAEAKPADQPTSEPQSRQSSDSQSPDPSSATPPPAIIDAVELAAGGLAEMFKWIFYGVFALAVAYVLWRSRAEILAAFREFFAALREFFNGLLGRKPRRAAAADQTASPIEFPPAPFSSYADPFASGSAARYSTAELVRYSFEAFEAWAREHGCARHDDQTPHELARDVGRLNASMAGEARNIAELYGRAAYSQGQLPAGGVDQLRQLWQRMRTAAS